MVASLAVVLLAASSCGKGKVEEPSANAPKLPPGMASSDIDGTSEQAAAAGEESSANTNAALGTADEESAGDAAALTGNTSVRTASLAGVEFTVVAAKRQDNNKLVASAGTREVGGDFLEVELRIRNAGKTLVSLPRFSFRLRNPHINAASYDDYYGKVTTYGGYVSRNVISATLLDYSTLHQVTATLRIGEEMGDVFLFFDLNPLSVTRNEGFTKEGANLIVYDTETGEKVEINLAGFPD